MFVHFSILILIIIVSYFYEHQFKANKIKVISEGSISSDYSGSFILWFIVFGYVAVLAGLRSGMNDTAEYILSFEHLSGSWNEIWTIITGTGKDKGFDITGNLFKMFVSRNYHMWFFFFSTIESILLCVTLRREAVSFLDTCFFFFATTMYYNYFSMLRQWFAIVIVFWASRFIKSKKFFPYLLFCLLAAQYHNSAYFMILAYFLISGESWNWKQITLIVVFVIGIILLNPLLTSVEVFMNNMGSDYADVINKMQRNQGSSWVRAVLAVVPVIFAFIYRKNEKCRGGMYEICVNASIVNVLINILAIFTSGLYVNRMATYFSIFNLLLYPYILNIVIPEKSRKIIKPLFYIFYLSYYIYQMTYSGSWSYVSEFVS